MATSPIQVGIFVLAIFLVLACTPPEPVVERVEVTRQVEVTVAVPQTVEVKVPFPQTRIVEQTVEVTREVPITVVVTATPPPVTATPRPTATPTRVPTPTATPVPLHQTESANLFVSFLNEGDVLKVAVTSGFDVAEYELTVLADGHEYCNTTRMYADDGLTYLSCEYETRPHSSVSHVSAQTPLGDLRCVRHEISTTTVTTFACTWR